MRTENITFLNNKSQKIAARIYREDKLSASGVIFSHGMFSGKDGYKITRLAEHIVNAGFTLLTFDFSFAGESEGHISELSILQEVDDLNSAFSFFKKYGMEKIHLVGSSLGGLVSMLFASVARELISSQVLIATPVLMNELFSALADTTDVSSMDEKGFTEVEGIQIHNRFFKEAMEINIERAIDNTVVPTLVIHGSEDKVVSLSNAVALIKYLNNEKRMVLIEGGDHNLIRDPDIEILRKNIIEWISKHND